MKKTYMIPQVLIVRVAPHRMISASQGMSLDSSDANQLGEGEILTKQNNFSVWSDDWSAE